MHTKRSAAFGMAISFVLLAGCAQNNGPLTFKEACDEVHPKQILEGNLQSEADRVLGLIKRSDGDAKVKLLPLGYAMADVMDGGASELVGLLDALKTLREQCEAVGSHGFDEIRT